MSIKSEVANAKENLIKSRKAILARGGEIATDAGFKDLPSAILNIPPDFALSFIEDDGVAYQKTAPENSLPYAQIKKIGGMTYKSKNLIPFPYADTSKTEAGVTWTVNTDGIVTANGTATENSYFTFVKGSTLLTIPYDMTISGCPSGGSDNKYQIHVWKPGFAIADNGTSAKVPAGTTYNEIYAVVRAGYTANNLTFKPMLNAGNTALPYEPFFKGLRHAKVESVKSEGANRFNESLITYAGHENGTVSANYGVVENGVLIAKISYYSGGILWKPFEMHLKKGSYTISADCYIPTGGAPSLQLYLGFRNLTEQRYYNGFKFLSAFDNWERVSVTINLERDAVCALQAQGSGNASQSTNLDVRFKNISVSSDGSSNFKPYVGTLGTFSIPQAVQELDGYGVGVNADCYNYIDLHTKTFVKKVGAVDLGTLDFSVYDSNENRIVFTAQVENIQNHYNAVTPAPILADGYSTVSQEQTWIAGDIAQSAKVDEYKYIRVVEKADVTLEEFKSLVNGRMLYYALETPEVTDISSLLAENNFIKVEGGGNLTFENEHGYAVPSTVKYVLGVG